MLANARILTKIVSVIAFIAVITACGVAFTGVRMSQIDDSYTRFIERDARAWVLATRLNIILYRTSDLVSQTVSATDPAEAKVLEQDLAKQFPDWIDTAKQVAAFAPAYAGRFDSYLQKVDAADHDRAGVQSRGGRQYRGSPQADRVVDPAAARPRCAGTA